MAICLSFVSHCPYWGVLLWNPEQKMYNLWHPFAYELFDDAKDAASVHDGIVVRWYWPSSSESFSSIFNSDLPF